MTRSLAASALLALAVLFPRVAHAQATFHVDDIADVKQHLDPPQSDKAPINVIVLSEGYTEDERADYESKVRDVITDLRTAHTTDPFREVNTFNIYEVWVPSQEKGAPWRNGEKAAKTAFGAHVDADGSLDADNDAIDRAVKHVAPKDGARTVAIVIINLKSKQADRKANAPKPGKDVGKNDLNRGPGDVRDITATPEDIYEKIGRGGFVHAHLQGRILQVAMDMRALIHEMGHELYGLDDEYANDESDRLPNDGIAGVAEFPNTTTDASGARWRGRVPDLYYPDGTIKHIYEGGAGYGKGVWHAYKTCRMNQSRTEDFCPVCQAAIRTFKNMDKPLSAPSLVKPVSGKQVAFTETRDGKMVTAQWQPAPGEQPNSYHLELSQNGKVVYKTDVEGQLTSASLPVPHDGTGDYTLSIYAQRIAVADNQDRSPTVSVGFGVPKDIAAVDALLAAEERAKQISSDDLAQIRARGTAGSKGGDGAVAKPEDGDRTGFDRVLQRNVTDSEHPEKVR